MKTKPKIKTNNQSEVLQALLTNNEVVIDRLYVSNYPKVEYFILNNNGNKQDAKDIFQEAFIVLWRKVRGGNFVPQNETGVEGFLYRVAKNKWLDYLRSAKYKKSESFDHLTDNRLMKENTEIEKDENHYEEKLSSAMAAFKHLGKDCQVLLKKFYFEKKNMQEIAKELVIGSASVRNKKYRCMQSLKDLVNNKRELT